jgi:hypothetical protein
MAVRNGEIAIAPSELRDEYMPELVQRLIDVLSGGI